MRNITAAVATVLAVLIAGEPASAFQLTYVRVLPGAGAPVYADPIGAPPRLVRVLEPGDIVRTAGDLLLHPIIFFDDGDGRSGWIDRTLVEIVRPNEIYPGVPFEGVCFGQEPAWDHYWLGEAAEWGWLLDPPLVGTIGPPPLTLAVPDRSVFRGRFGAAELVAVITANEVGGTGMRDGEIAARVDLTWTEDGRTRRYNGGCIALDAAFDR